MRRIIGLVAMLIGAGGMDSENMLFPICCLAAGALLISWEVLDEKRKSHRVHDYTSKHDDNRPYFLP